MKSMKKLFILIMVPFLFLASCNKSDNLTKPKVENSNISSNKDISQHVIKDYYPFKENIRMKYAGEGSEFAPRSIYTDFIKEDTIQIRIRNSGGETAQVLQIKNNELRLINSTDEFYYRDDLTNIKNDNYQVLLKEPLVKGTSWTLPNGNKRYISDVEKAIKTPAGEYKALEVTTEGKDFKQLDYYVLNIGHVQSIYKGDSMKVTISLENIDENASVIQTVNFYYPDYANAKTVYVKRKLSFNTNDTLIPLLEKHFKNSPSKNIMHLIGPNVKINKVYLDRDKNTAIIDFSDNFVKEMNVGSGPEMEILKCIANTLGNYYNVDKTCITLDGKPYASGHILLKEGETIKVDFNNVEEYK